MPGNAPVLGMNWIQQGSLASCPDMAGLRNGRFVVALVAVTPVSVKLR
jgi:hypothetical protein